MKRKPWLLQLLLLSLVALLIVAGALLWRDRQLKQTITAMQSYTTPYVIQPVEYLPGDAIRKYVRPNNMVHYELIGSFVSPPEVKWGSVLGGKFRLDGYPDGQEIEVLVGTGGDSMQRGLFQDSFEGTETWEQVRTMDIAGELMRRQIMLRTDLSLDQSQDIFAFSQPFEQAMDALIHARRSGDYRGINPDLSKVVFPSVGWVEDKQ